ncbi:MAG: hypothetical protein JO086_12365 [Acidimicrobiia bacterium]|nr:hypothetical protein [Acidimicrobiia bacterium]
MAVVWLWLRAELRRRWRVQVVLALLVGVVGAVILTVAAGARETSSAYRDFLSRQRISDAQFDSLQPDARAGVATLPGVRAAGTYAALFVAPTRQGAMPGQDFLMFAAADNTYGRAIDRPIILQGRVPNPLRPTRWP